MTDVQTAPQTPNHDSMKQSYQNLTDSDTFRDFVKERPNDYLVHAFLMKDSQYEENWQFGFFNEETDTVTSFLVKLSTNTIERQNSEEVMKRPEDKLLKLTFQPNYISGEQAIWLAQEYVDKNYHGKSPKSKILILQHTAEFGPIWNLTIITVTFDAVNLKIDAQTGEIKKADAHSLLDLQNNDGQ